MWLKETVEYQNICLYHVVDYGRYWQSLPSVEFNQTRWHIAHVALEKLDPQNFLSIFTSKLYCCFLFIFA